MIYFVMACAVTAWVLAVRDMVVDTDWDYVPDEYKEGGGDDGADAKQEKQAWEVEQSGGRAVDGVLIKWNL